MKPHDPKCNAMVFFDACSCGADEENMDTKSETTKRIELREILDGIDDNKLPRKIALDILATHLHEEVIRGKIEEHKKYFGWECTDCNPEGFAEHHISLLKADLERQIGEGK